MKEALDLSFVDTRHNNLPSDTRNYFGLYQGEVHTLSELGDTKPVVEAMAESGRAVIQHNLPFDGKQDATVWIPEKVAERKARQEYEVVRNKYLAIRGDVNRKAA